MKTRWLVVCALAVLALVIAALPATAAPSQGSRQAFIVVLQDSVPKGLSR